MQRRKEEEQKGGAGGAGGRGGQTEDETKNKQAPLCDSAKTPILSSYRYSDGECSVNEPCGIEKLLAQISMNTPHVRR